MSARYPWLSEAVSGRFLRRGPPIEDCISHEAAATLNEMAGALINSGRQVGSGAIKGALTGFTVGGPAGGIVGAGLGGLSATRTKAPGNASGADLSRAGPQAGSQSADPGTGTVQSPGVNPFAVQLLATLLRPEVIQALTAMSLGPRGAPTIPVANVPVPLSAFTSLIQSLADRAAAEYHKNNVLSRHGESWAEYLGDSGIEQSQPEERANALLNLLAIQSEMEGDDSEFSSKDEEDDDDEVHEILDLMDIYRLTNL